MKSKQRRSEQGSVFVLTMLVLGVLTIVGLSLAVVTETEMLLGANDWVISETQFAAESALSTQIGMLLVANDTLMIDVVTPSYFSENHHARAGFAGTRRLGFELESSCLLPVSIHEMAYTKLNEGSTDSLSAGWFYTHARAQRLSWERTQVLPSCADKNSISAQKRINNGFYYAPMDKFQADALINFERCGRDDTTTTSTSEAWKIVSNNLCAEGETVNEQTF